MVRWEGAAWRPLIAATLAVAVALGFALSALAQEVPPLRERLTDQAGVIENASRIEDAIEQLERDHDVQLWVLFVGTTGSQAVTDYSDAVAARNSFGGNDALLLVAVDDRSDALWVGSLLDGVTDEEIDLLLTRELEPRLARGDFEGAVAALAQGLGRALDGESTSGGDGDGGGGAGVLRGILTFLAVIVVAPVVFIGAIALIVLIVRKVRGKRVQGEAGRASESLDKRANALLLQADDVLREAEQELGFAEAQFSEADVAPFRQAMDGARGEMRRAFEIRQALDDTVPEPASLRKTMLEELVQRAGNAISLIDAQRGRIEELRDLERAAPELLPALPAKIAGVEARLPEARLQMAELQRFAESLSLPVEGSVMEAGKRLEFAREVVDSELNPSGDEEPRGAVMAVRLSQAAIAEAGVLLDGIAHLADSVRTASGSLPQELAAAEADVTAARRAIADGRVDGVGEPFARAQALLESAQRESSQARPDVILALQQAQQANQLADTVLDGVREAEERRAREAAAFAAAASRAASAYDRADDYIAGRRPQVGEEPRTRLREAQRRLEASRSLERTDLRQALVEAESAERLASEALRLAQREFEDRTRRDDDDDRRGDGRPRSRDRDADVLGSVLGGVVGGILAGGMRGGGTGFGGTDWGKPGRPGRIGGGFRIPSGGGGRSRGGRW